MNDDAAPQWAWLERPHDAAGRALPAERPVRAWLAARLGGAPEALPLVRDERGRPRLRSPLSDWDCNWSHTGTHLLVALGAGVRVGADVERLRPRPRALDLARRYYDAGEARALAALAPGAVREAAFVRLWCAKEALLKAHGHGLSFGLHRVRFDLDDGGAPVLVDVDPALGSVADWTLRAVPAPAGCTAMLAWRAHPSAILRA